VNPLYKIDVFDNRIPFSLRKEVYDYIYTQRWYTGYRKLPTLDIDPSKSNVNDSDPPPVHRTITRAPFCGISDHLKYHPPIEKLFHFINQNVFENKLSLDGLREPSPGLKYPGLNWPPISDAQLRNEVPFYEPNHPELDIEWRKYIFENGSIAYMQAQPFESHRQTRIPHRDWAGRSIDENPEGYATVIYIANLNWRPEWFGELTMYENAFGDIPGTKFEDLYKNRNVGIGYPGAVIENIPGRIVVQDGRQLHATRAVGETAPEPTLHVNFRVRIR